MTAFRINLIRSQVAPPRERRLMFWGMFLYLFVCGALLVVTANSSARKLVSASAGRHQMAVLDVEFRKARPGQTDMLRFARSLESDLGKLADRLHTIESVLTERVNLVDIIQGLWRPLPGGVTVMSLHFEEQDRLLQFDLMIPEGLAGETVNASQWMTAWNRDPVLMSAVNRIDSVTAQRQKVARKSMFVFKFDCTVK